jgi:ABC-type oligopeptide transport system ATPase subunit
VAGNLLLEAKGLKKVFTGPNGGNKAVNDVHFRIHAGECYGLIGESGSGKSTVAHMIAGLLDCTEGVITFEGKHLPEKSCREGFRQRQHMQMIFQNPLSSFSPKMTLLYSICEGLRYRFLLSRHDMERRAYQMMEMVGLKKEYATRFCGELSGGECQRAAIARAIISHPKLLICDESTSALDVSIQAQIMQLLAQLKKELNLSYLFISHDIALVSSISDSLAVMKDGSIVEEGKPEDVIWNPKQTYTSILVKAARP